MAVDFSATPGQRGLQASHELVRGDEVAELLRLAVMDPISQTAAAPEVLDRADELPVETEELADSGRAEPDEAVVTEPETEPERALGVQSEHVARARRTLEVSRQMSAAASPRSRDRQR